MKTPYKNIYDVLQTNRFVVITVVSGALISSLLFGWMMYDIQRTALNNSFAINTDGSVIPLKWVLKKRTWKWKPLRIWNFSITTSII